MIPYTLCPICPAPRCTWTSMLECMTLSGLRFCQWNQSTSPSVSQLYMRLGVIWGLEPYPCNSTPSESKPWTLYLATMGDYSSPCCLGAHPNPLPVACCFAFILFSSPEFHLHISLKPFHRTACKSILHYRNYPNAASSRMSSKNLQWLSPFAGVNLEPVSNGSAPG